MKDRPCQDGYLFDPHVHTKEVSRCGWLKGREMARLYGEAGYDGIVITDHLHAGTAGYLERDTWSELVGSFLRGYGEAEEEGRRIGLTVFWGVEVTLALEPAGDFLVYGIDRRLLEAHPRPFDGDLPALREWTSGEDMLVYQAHPFRDGNCLAPANLIDGIEVINGNPRRAYDSQGAFAAAATRGLRCIAGSDAHRTDEACRTGIVLPERPRSMAEFVTLLRAGPVPLRLLRESQGN